MLIINIIGHLQKLVPLPAPMVATYRIQLLTQCALTVIAVVKLARGVRLVPFVTAAIQLEQHHIIIQSIGLAQHLVQRKPTFQILLINYVLSATASAYRVLEQQEQTA